MHFYYIKRIQDVGDYTNATDVPFRFVPCMTAGLAFIYHKNINHKWHKLWSYIMKMN